MSYPNDIRVTGMVPAPGGSPGEMSPQGVTLGSALTGAVASVYPETFPMRWSSLGVASWRLDGKYTEDGKWEQSMGGVATGLNVAIAWMSANLSKTPVKWWGVPGSLKPELHDKVREDLQRRNRVPVFLDPRFAKGFYDYANGCDWPGHHGLLDKIEVSGRRERSDYEAVQAHFAQTLHETSDPDTTFLINDYQVAGVIDPLRKLRPDVTATYTHHVPFQPPEIYARIPFAEQRLDALLKHDVITLHIPRYVRNLLDCAVHLFQLDVDHEKGVVRYDGRDVLVKAIPFGINAPVFAQQAQLERIVNRAREIRRGFTGKIIVGVDRLDYTKELDLKLKAYAAFLRSLPPDERKNVRLVHIFANPRVGLNAYEEHEALLKRLEAEIHQEFGKDCLHIEWHDQPTDQVVAHMLAGDVFWANSTVDGMLLAPMEYVASRTDGSGALVLSEWTGAAAVLGKRDSAILVNPHHIEGVVERLSYALRMSREEQQRRMAAALERIEEHSVLRWGQELATAAQAVRSQPSRVAYSTPAEILGTLAKLRSATKLEVLVDHDGTMAPLVHGAEAPLSPAAGETLTTLAERPNTSVHVVSSRNFDDLQRIYADLPVGIHADGIVSWLPGQEEAKRRQFVRQPDGRLARIDLGWKPIAYSIMQMARANLLESDVGLKESGVVFHFRNSAREHLSTLLPALRKELQAHLPQTVDIIVSMRDQVVEARARGINQDHVYDSLPQPAPGTMRIYIGDSQREEGLFTRLKTELGENGIAIGVGDDPKNVDLRLRNVDQVIAFLRSLTAPPEDLKALWEGAPLPSSA